MSRSWNDADADEAVETVEEEEGQRSTRGPSSLDTLFSPLIRRFVPTPFFRVLLADAQITRREQKTWNRTRNSTGARVSLELLAVPSLRSRTFSPVHLAAIPPWSPEASERDERPLKRPPI